SPSCRRLCGKVYWPCASVVTLTSTIEPGFLAVTTTPSILPSASELTVPVRAAWPCAQTVGVVGWKSITAALAVKLNISLLRIGVSLVKLILVGLKLESLGIVTDSMDSRRVEYRDSASVMEQA